MQVSIIIPAYNCAPYIEATIHSVEVQTFPQDQIQLIIVNDGSTDNTGDILEQYKQRCLVITTANKGVSHARNTGLKYATGNYIQYLDSDDLLMPDKIEVQVRALTENDADVAYGDWYKFKEVNGNISVTEEITRNIKGDQELALFTDFWCPPAALLYSRRIVDKIGPWKEWLPVIQDARYFLDAALEKGKLIYTPVGVAKYREHQSGSLSTRSKRAFMEDVFNNLKDIHKTWLLNNELSAERLAAIKNGLSNCIHVFSTLNSPYLVEAIDYLLQIDPDYKPSNSGALRFLSQFLGYKNAERIATIKRRFFN